MYKIVGITMVIRFQLLPAYRFYGETDVLILCKWSKPKVITITTVIISLIIVMNSSVGNDADICDSRGSVLRVCLESIRYKNTYLNLIAFRYNVKF